MLLRRIADARVFNCEDDRGRLGVKEEQFSCVCCLFVCIQKYTLRLGIF